MAVFNKVVMAVAAMGTVLAAPSQRDGVDNTQPFGTNVVGSKFTVQFLGNQVADNSCTHRDLGFAGHLGGQWFAVYGDNLWCDAGVTDPAQDPTGFHGLVRDSVSALGNDPLKVHDLHLNNDSPVQHPLQLVPFNSAWGESNTSGFGGTSIVEVDGSAGIGAVYYLVNNNEDYVGAGIAKLQLQNGVPTVVQRYGDTGYWWDGHTTAHYGDVAAYQDDNSEYTYILGNPPSSQSGFPASSYIYQARVKSSEAFELGSYEYWWGRSQGWKPDVLTTFSPETAVMWGTGQGQIVWSPHFNAYLYVHIGGNTLNIRSAASPEGPWSADQAIYEDKPVQDGGFIYAGLAYPYLDTTGQTLTVGWTNSNTIRVAKITFT